NPANGKIIEEIKIDTKEEIEKAIKDTNNGFKKWSRIDAHQRSHLLKKWSEKIQENKKNIAETMTKENGKPLDESLGEIDYATSYIDWYSEEAKRIYGRTVPANNTSKRIIISRQPV